MYKRQVLGRVTNEQFRMLSADYNEEQLERLKASVNNVDSFIEKAK